METTLDSAELRRVTRQTLLPSFGLAGQEALQAAHVLVIGAGGLGCPVMQALASTGVGAITVIDDDTVDITNIHRQILFDAADVGRPKAATAVAKLRAIQPGIRAEAIHARMTRANAVSLLDGVDVLIDGSDNFDTKFLAADAAEITGTPLVWGTVLRFRGDVGVWWSGPGVDLDRDTRGVGLRDLFPAYPDPSNVPDCATAGVLGVTTSAVGTLMATETIKFLTGLNADPQLPLAQARATQVGNLMIYDALSAQVQHFHVPADPAREPVTDFVPAPHFPACAVPADAASSNTADTTHAADDLLGRIRNKSAIPLDVRELGEKAIRDLPTATANPGYHLPTSAWQGDGPSAATPPTGTTESTGTNPAVKLLRQIADVSDQTDVIVYCASGRRSQAFVDHFADPAAQLGISLHNLPGGANENGVDLRG